MDFENVLEQVGGFHRYQKLLLALLSSVLMLNVTHLYVQVFTAGESDHWCKAWEDEDCPDPGVDCGGLKKNLSVPNEYSEDEGVEYKQCVKYNVSGIDLNTAIGLGVENISALGEISCDEGWNHDRSTFPSTIIIDFELVCGKSNLPNIAQSTYFAGVIVGSAFGGVLADIIGRRWTALIAIVSFCAIGAITIFTPVMAVFIAMRFLVGVFSILISLPQFVLLLEMTTKSKRVFVTNAYFLAFALGYFLLAGLAKLIRSWRILQLVITVPYLVVIVLVYFVVLESPSWLLSKGSKDQAQIIVTKIAKINGTENATLQDVDVKGEKPPTMKASTILREFIRSPLLLLVTINMAFNWAVQSFIFYGLSLSTSSLGIDPYLSFLVSGAIEIPAYFACMFVAEWLGRKGSVVSSMVLGGICCCSSTLFPTGITRALVAMSGKFFITISYSIVYTWSAELIPTCLRSSGIGLFSTSSRIGSVLAPLVLLVDDVWMNLPYLVFGSLAIAAGLLSLLIPETKGKPLPTTLQDTKALFRSKPDEKVIGLHGTDNPAVSPDDSGASQESNET